MASGVDPVRQSVEVPLDPRDAFELFTSGIAQWWPFETHRARGPVETVVLEGRHGGQLREVCSDGAVAIWGHVAVWEPPSRLVISWTMHLSPPTEVEVRFTPTPEGCRVDLEHRGFGVYGDEEGTARRVSYEGGWPTVLRRFAEAACGTS